MRIVLALLGVVLSFSLVAEEGASVWCAGESLKIRPSDAPQEKNGVWDGAAKAVRLGSARNEYVAFQIAVKASNDDVQGVTVEPSDLKGPGEAVIPAENIDLFVEHYLNVKVSSRGSATELMPQCTPGEHPTQMIPFNAKRLGAPFSVFAKRNQPVWVDIYVPEDAAPGAYSGKFAVKAGDLILAELAVSLEVWNFTLPHETHFKSFLYTGPENVRWGHRLIAEDTESPKYMAIEEQYFQMAHQHRLNYNASAGGVVQELTKRYLKYYDGRAFTERVGKGVGQNVLNMPPEGKTEGEFKKNAQDIVAAVEKTGVKADLFGYIWDEPGSPEDFEESKRRCGWVHDAVGKKLKTFIATPQWEKYAAGDVDIFSETKIPDIPKVLEREGEVYAVNAGYAAGPFVDSPGYGGRSIPWMNWAMKLSGYQFWDCCYWVDRQNLKHKEGNRWVRNMTFKEINDDPERYLTDLYNDPLSFDETRKKGYPAKHAIRINGDGVLFYPGYDVGVNGPIASWAMKSLRRGAQDYEYLWLLKQAGKDEQINEVVASVIPEPGKWNDDPEAWDKARLRLAEMLTNLAKSEGAKPVSAPAEVK